MTRSVAIRILSLAAAIGLLSQALLIGNVFGINLPLLAAALLAAAIALRPAGRAMDPLDLWLPVAAIAVVAGIAIRSDPFLVFLDIGAGCLLLGAGIAAIGGSSVTRRSADRVAEAALLVLAWSAGGGVLRVTIAARRGRPGDEPIRRLPTRIVPVARGLLIAIPILLVFAGLFSAADAVFARLTDQLFGWQIDLGEMPIRLAVAFLIGWVVAGLLAVRVGRARAARPSRTDAAVARRGRRRRRRRRVARGGPPTAAARVDGGSDDPDRGRRPVRGVRGPPAGVPVRRAGYARRNRTAVRPLRAERLLRVGPGCRPGGRAPRRGPRTRRACGRRGSWGQDWGWRV